MNKINTGTFRMFHWFLISVLLYTAAVVLAHFEQLPQIQTVCWKLGNINIAAYFGYRLDRSIFQDRLSEETVPLCQLRRAAIIGCAMLAVAMGL